MSTQKMLPGSDFPEIALNTLNEESVSLSRKTAGADWKLLVVYRGKHCPLCVKYLNNLEQHKAELSELGVDIAAVCADSRAQLVEFMEKLDVSYPIHYGLTIEQMQQLGLYLSSPRSEQESDHVYAEPAIFVINGDGKLHIVNIANNPFIRPELSELVSGIRWLKNPENNYPIRGTYS